MDKKHVFSLPNTTQKRGLKLDKA